MLQAAQVRCRITMQVPRDPSEVPHTMKAVLTVPRTVPVLYHISMQVPRDPSEVPHTMKAVLMVPRAVPVLYHISMQAPRDPSEVPHTAKTASSVLRAVPVPHTVKTVPSAVLQAEQKLPEPALQTGQVPLQQSAAPVLLLF